MNRREIIAGLGSAAAWPLAARAQQPAMPVIAFITGGGADGTTRRLAAFRTGLGESGYVEGRTVSVEYHWLEGQTRPSRTAGCPETIAPRGRRHMADLNEAMGNIRQVTFEEVTRIFYGYDGRGTWYPSPRWSCPLASWSRLIKSAPLKAGSSCVTLRRGISRLARGTLIRCPFSRRRDSARYRVITYTNRLLNPFDAGD